MLENKGYYCLGGGSGFGLSSVGGGGWEGVVGLPDSPPFTDGNVMRLQRGSVSARSCCRTLMHEGTRLCLRLHPTSASYGVVLC